MVRPPISEVGGGGPTKPHVHKHNPLFFVAQGEAGIRVGGERVIIHRHESFYVKGLLPHSVWNHADEETVILGITVWNKSAV